MFDFDTIAAVDLGSNSFHMVIARVKDEELQVIDRLKEMVQLAAGLDEHNRLDKASRQRAVEALRKFGERLRPLPSGAVRVVGTNTLRQARNSREFLAQAEDCLGHPVEIISGSEEARLIYLGVAHSIQHLWGRRLVVDIGGGSTEVIVGADFEPEIRESKYMGCVSYTRRFFSDGRITREAFRRAEIAARQELQPSVADFVDAGWDMAIGASGTIRAIRDISEGLGIANANVTLDAMKRIRKLLIEQGTIDRIELPSLSEPRRAVFCGGLAILIGTFKSLEIHEMMVSDGALREGVLYDLLGRIHDHDVREETIRQLAAKYQVDEEHAVLVEQTALGILAAVRDDWELQGPVYEHMLRWAAHIHEIGLAISHSRYHKHGSYLVENADMPGFSKQDQQCLWALVRSHRRRFKLHRFDNLPEPLNSAGPKLAILLRLAVLLNRSRDPEDVPPFSIKAIDKKTLQMRFPNAGLEWNPLTAADLAEEARYLADAGVALRFS